MTGIATRRAREKRQSVRALGSLALCRLVLQPHLNLGAARVGQVRSAAVVLVSGRKIGPVALPKRVCLLRGGGRWARWDEHLVAHPVQALDQPLCVLLAVLQIEVGGAQFVIRLLPQQDMIDHHQQRVRYCLRRPLVTPPGAHPTVYSRGRRSSNRLRSPRGRSIGMPAPSSDSGISSRSSAS